MRYILDEVVGWLRAGQPAVLATVVDVKGRTPRDVGAAMAVDQGGRVAGSVSGGCVEPALIQLAPSVLESGEPRLVSFGISDEEAWGVGLACGGTLHVLLEPIIPIAGGGGQGADVASLLAEVAQAVEAGQPVALAHILDGAPGARGVAMAFLPGGSVRTAGVAPELARQVEGEARRMLEHGKTGRVQVGGLDIFLHGFTPPPVLHIIGAVHPARALAVAGRFLGYRVVVCDPRSPFATPERIPEADEIVRRWPDGHLAEAGLSPRDAVCILTHDLKFDVPAIQAALKTPVGYIGVMGSRRTQARRIASLREQGVPEAELQRLAAPIGLDIGARTPAEMAVAIMAEIIAHRNQKAGSSGAGTT